MKSILTLAVLLLGSLSQASDIDHLPKSFVSDGKRAVFVDYESAVYDIAYGNATARVIAEMTFQNAEEGYPIFDSHSNPTDVKIDGLSTSATLINTPDRATQLRRVETSVKPGNHSLRIEIPIRQLVEFAPNGVKSGFWMTDLKERGYLERYLPTNLIYDRIPMKFRVRFADAANQAIYTNGTLRKIDSQNFEIDFPDYFTASSLYFHTTPAETMNERLFNFTTISGKSLPVTIYTAAGANSSATLDDAQSRVLSSLQGLESNFGSFPHPSLTVYIASGGMEYSGATMTSLGALAHELFHSYFARGFMPADGNSGWIDEALAVWHDVGYTSMSTLSGSSMMAGHAYYTRATDTDAYSFGKDFMSYLNAKFAAQGGLKPFLNHILQTRIFAPMTTEEFMAEMSAYYRVPVEPEFRKYVYGSEKTTSHRLKRNFGPHGIDQLRTEKELRPYL